MGSEENVPRPDESTAFADRQQDPLVERLRRDPSKPPVAQRILEGVLGDSDRPGFRRLYFTAELDYYAEFRTDEVRSFSDIPPEAPPFVGEQATRVTLDRAAQVDFVRSHRALPADEFDLDVRLAGTRELPSPLEWPLESPPTGACETGWPGCYTARCATYTCPRRYTCRYC